MQTKFFKEDTLLDLERKVNDFIKNKTVVNISYSVAKYDYGYIHCCCVLYNTFG